MSHPDAEAVLRPFDVHERAALLDAVFAADLDDASEDQPAENLDDDALDNDAPSESATRRGTRTRVVLGSLAALAAAVLLFFVLRAPSGGPVGPPIVSLPSYAITSLHGGIAATRADHDGHPSEIELRPEGAIDWVMTPQRATRERVALVIIVTPDGGRPQLLTPPPTQTIVTSDGVVRLRGKVSEVLGLPTGTWTVELVVTPVSRVPRTVAEARAGGFPSDTFRATLSHG